MDSQQRQEEEEEEEEVERCLDNHGEGPAPKKEKNTSHIGLDSISGLPDAILVHIGNTVAKLCGVRNFVRLSQTSKRLRRLLIDSQETATNVLRIRTAQININHSNTIVSSLSSTPIILRTLEQLALYESCCGCYGECLEKGAPQPSNVLEKNLISWMSEDEFDDLVDAVQTILEKNPSASVLLDLHTGSDDTLVTDPAPIGMKFLRAILNIPASCRYDPMDPRFQRVSMRNWERRVTETVIASKSKEPYAQNAKSGGGWVEIFLRIEERYPYEPEYMNTIQLELPPRPDFYKTLRVPQKVDWIVDDEYENFVLNRHVVLNRLVAGTVAICAWRVAGMILQTVSE